VTLAPFDDRDGLIWQDGRFVPWREARLHVLTHGLHYGGAVFEGIRVYGGHMFRAADHFRLPYDEAALSAATQELMDRQDIADGYVRPVAWRGSDQISVSGTGTSVHVAIAVWKWPHVFTPGARERGIRLRTSRWRRPAPDTAPVGAKAACLYALCTLARDEAEAQDYDDALLLDFRGHLAEATGANLFLVVDGSLHTPVPDSFLNGITRQTVISLARDLGIAVYERHIPPAELDRADEVFLTGTAYEVQPVRAVDDRSYPVGKTTGALSEAYARLVKFPR
jgi:branched-chain amino acid aminotransferase